MIIKTITSTEGVNEVDFGSSASRYYWFQNLGTATVHVSANADITAGADGVAELAAGGIACIEALGGKVYVLGAGKVLIYNTGDKFCPFKPAPAASGGGEAVDAYTKSESDARYPLAANTVPRGLGFGYGTCTTAASTAAKAATISGTNTPNFVDRDGGIIAIKFTNAVQKMATLNVNGSGAKSIFYHGRNIVDGVINAGDTVTLMQLVSVYHVIAVENGHTVNADVPENAVFTDTVPDLSGYAKLTDIPSSLPANGGNADTIDGKHASELVSALSLNNVVENYVAIPDNVNVAEWLIENAKIGTTYTRSDANVGQTNLPGGIDRWTYITYDGNRYLARVLLTPDSTTDFLLDYIYYPDGVNIKGWKEISATPLKSMTVSGTTNSFSDLALFTISSGKIPVFIACDDVYCTPCSSTTGAYYAHMTSAHRDSMANVAIDSATVYYIQT